MNKIVKELRKTNAAARDLRAARMELITLLLLDEELLKLEAELDLMDGMEVIKDGQ